MKKINLNQIKKIALVFLCLSVLVFVTGCGKKQETQTSNVQGEQNQPQNQQLNWEENFEEINLSDLKINDNVLVIGKENSDGSFSAQQIILADDNLENMPGMMRPTTTNNDDQQNSEQINQHSEQINQRPEISDEQRANFQNLQNMNEEERQKFMETMRAQRGNQMDTKTGGTRTFSATSRITGEILDKDATTLTLKVAEGGSKLIFFSEQTKILKPKAVETE